MPAGGVHHLQRGREIAPALVEVPEVVEPVAGGHVPLGVAVHGRGDGTDAGAGQDVEPAVPGDGEVDDGGGAALQQLGDGVLGRGLVGRELGRGAARLLGEARGHEDGFLVEDAGHVEAGVAQLLDQAAAQAFGLQVGVDVHHARHQAECRAVDHRVGRPGVVGVEMDQPVVLEHHVDVLAEEVLLLDRVPGDHPAGAPNAMNGHATAPPATNTPDRSIPHARGARKAGQGRDFGPSPAAFTAAAARSCCAPRRTRAPAGSSFRRRRSSGRPGRGLSRRRSVSGRTGGWPPSTASS